MWSLKSCSSCLPALTASVAALTEVLVSCLSACLQVRVCTGQLSGCMCLVLLRHAQQSCETVPVVACCEHLPLPWCSIITGLYRSAVLSPAGIVFTPCCEPYLVEEYGEEWMSHAPPQLLKLLHKFQEHVDEQVGIAAL